MKKTTSKLLSLLLALVMVLGLLPMTAFAAGEGQSEDNPVVCTNYEEFRHAMYDESIKFVEMKNISQSIFVSRRFDIYQQGEKHIILSGNNAFTVWFDKAENGGDQDAALIYNDGNNLTISGDGWLNVTVASNLVNVGTASNFNSFSGLEYPNFNYRAYSFLAVGKNTTATIEGGNYVFGGSTISGFNGSSSFAMLEGTLVFNGGHLEFNPVTQTRCCGVTGKFTDPVYLQEYLHGPLFQSCSSTNKIVFNGGEYHFGGHYSIHDLLTSVRDEIKVKDLGNYIDVQKGCFYFEKYAVSDFKELVPSNVPTTQVKNDVLIVGDVFGFSSQTPEPATYDKWVGDLVEVQFSLTSLPSTLKDKGCYWKNPTAIMTSLTNIANPQNLSVIDLNDGKWKIAPYTFNEAGKYILQYNTALCDKDDNELLTRTAFIGFVVSEKPLNSVTLTMSDKEFKIGEKLEDYSFSTTTTGVENAKTRIWRWYRDDSVVSEDSSIVTGRYSAMLNFYSKDGYQFAADTKFSFGGTDYSATSISNGGTFAAVKVDVGELICTHNFGDTYICKSGMSEDAYFHWQICSVCGAASAKVKHTYDYDDPAVNADTATYTCTAKGCEHQYSIEIPPTYTIKTVKTNEELFAVGNTIPTAVSDFPVVGKPGYSVTGVEWKKANGSDAGITFESGIEYLLTLTVETSQQYTIETLASGTPTGIKIANYSKSTNLSAGGVAATNWDAIGLFENTGGNTYKITIKGTPYSKPNVTITMPESLVGMSYLDAIKTIDYGTAPTLGNGDKYYMVTIYDDEAEVYSAAKTSSIDWTGMSGTDSALVSGKTYRFDIRYGWSGEGSGDNKHHVRYGWTADNITIENAISGSKVIEPIAFSVDAICTVGSNKISTVAVTDIETPSLGNTPDTTASVPNNASYIVQEVVWEGNPVTFAANNVYTVKVTLKVKEGYLFDESIAASVNGFDANAAPSQDNKTCTVTYEFPKTVLSISIAEATLTGTMGTQFSTTLTATPNTDITWMKNGGVLPNGMSLYSDGTLSGIPAEAGSFTFKVIAANSNGASAEKEFTMVVNEVPTVWTDTLTAGLVGKVYSETLSASGYPDDMTWELASGDLPDGLFLNTTTGEIYGTPTTAEAKTFTVAAKNNAGTSKGKELSITVGESGEVAYTITVETDGNGTASASLEYATKDTSVSLTATPNAGHHFKEWVVVSGSATITSNNKFVMPEGPVTIRATFEKNSGGGGGVTYDYYKLTFDTNGGSYIAPITRIEGTTVSLASYTPTRAGYVFTGWYSSAALTSKITSITLNSDKTVYAGWAKENPNTGGWENPFIDVFEKDWFYDDVRFAHENDLMKGTSSNTFSPNVTTTRGMIVTVLYRLEGEPTVSGACPFDDVKSGSYYEDAIIWAAQNDIVNGYGNNKFGPEDDITREQMAAILFRYADYKGYNISGRNSLAAFTDAGKVSSYALDNVKWAVDAGLINGMGDGTLAPQGNATRAQIAAILHRFIDKFVK